MKLFKLIFILPLTLIIGCSQFFPDKEKDYVYSKEVTPLEIPPDLQAEKSSSKLDLAIVPATLSNTITRIDKGGAASLHINSSFAHAWRVVGKALTATSIEITDKNRSNALYFVQYDPDLQIVQDGSFWDEVVFFFGSDPNQEKPYQVYLTQTGQGTDIIVRDELGNALNQGNGLKLLDLLYETIQKDFTK